jgi:hypothetical protein
MRRLMTGCAVGLGVMAITAAAAVAQTGPAGTKPAIAGTTFSCTASAGVTKADTARLTGDLQRTGGYKVKVSAAAAQLVVTVEPEEPKRSGSVTRVPAVIENVLLRSPFKSEAIAQPANVEKEPVQWSNAPAGAGDANRAVATFDLKAVQAIPAGDVLLVVNTADGERVCRMGAKDRRRIGGDSR